jgi:hypothetical protein
MTLMRQLIERVRRCAAHLPLLVCTDGFVAYIRRSVSETRVSYWHCPLLGNGP